MGKAYCSLPLPVETGFPVHLNGFFDLDSSRHALTTDSGQTWRQTAPTSRHPGLLTVDPAAASGVYVGLSYPLGVEATTTGGTLWRTVLP